MHGSLRSWLAERAPGRKTSSYDEAPSSDAEGPARNHPPIEIVDLDSELDALGVGPDMVFELDDLQDDVHDP
jgi:hypothetical protein